jgi:hypothetical protein
LREVYRLAPLERAVGGADTRGSDHLNGLHAFISFPPKKRGFIRASCWRCKLKTSRATLGPSALQQPVDFLDNQLRQMAIAFLLKEPELPIESWVQLQMVARVDMPSARHITRSGTPSKRRAPARSGLEIRLARQNREERDRNR